MSWPPDDRRLLVYALSQAAAGRRLDWRFHTFKFSSFSRKDSKGGIQVYSESEGCILGNTFSHLFVLNCFILHVIRNLILVHVVCAL